jgi:hypothetical protein
MAASSLWHAALSRSRALLIAVNHIRPRRRTLLNVRKHSETFKMLDFRNPSVIGKINVESFRSLVHDDEFWQAAELARPIATLLASNQGPCEVA